MNGLADSLYNIYNYKKTTKELLESLNLKYKTENVMAKKLDVDRFIDYKCNTPSRERVQYMIL